MIKNKCLPLLMMLTLALIPNVEAALPAPSVIDVLANKDSRIVWPTPLERIEVDFSTTDPYTWAPLYGNPIPSLVVLYPSNNTYSIHDLVRLPVDIGNGLEMTLAGSMTLTANDEVIGTWNADVNGGVNMLSQINYQNAYYPALIARTMSSKPQTTTYRVQGHVIPMIRCKFEGCKNLISGYLRIQNFNIALVNGAEPFWWLNGRSNILMLVSSTLSQIASTCSININPIEINFGRMVDSSERRLGTARSNIVVNCQAQRPSSTVQIQLNPRQGVNPKNPREARTNLDNVFITHNLNRDSSCDNSASLYWNTDPNTFVHFSNFSYADQYKQSQGFVSWSLCKQPGSVASGVLDTSITYTVRID